MNKNELTKYVFSQVYLDLTSKGYSEAGHVAEEVFSNIQSDDDKDGHGVELNWYSNYNILIIQELTRKVNAVHLLLFIQKKSLNPELLPLFLII